TLGNHFAANPSLAITQEDIFDAARTARLTGRGEASYSNFSVALLRQILALNDIADSPHLTGETILDTARMKDTYVSSETNIAADAPRGLAANGKETAPWGMDGYAPAGSSRATAADMSKYASFLLENSEFEFGWFPEDSGGYWHNGGTYGFSTMLIVDPEKNEAFFTSGNTPQGVEELAVAIRPGGNS